MKTCFSGETRVHMESGEFLSIERVRVGDMVLSRCEFTGEMASKKVIKTFSHVCDDGTPNCFVIYSTTTTNPQWLPEWKLKCEREGVISVAPEHPIYFVDSYKAKTTAREIRQGDIFFHSDGKQVMALRVEANNDIVKIYWTLGWNGIWVTPEQPIWVQGKGWTAVRDLQPGVSFLTSDGASSIVQRVEMDNEAGTVFNLQVEDFHSYFVGSGIWVHN